MISKVFFDLDDVLNHFTTYTLSKKLGRCVDESEYPRACGFRLYDAYKNLGGVVPRFGTERSFWQGLDNEHWRTVPTDYEMLDVFRDFAEAYGRRNIFILTAPTEFPECWSGKCQWIRRVLPLWVYDNVILTRSKSLLASPDRLLIDDREENVRSWRKAGGVSQLVVKPWNYGVLKDGVTNYQACREWLQHAGVHC